MNPYPIQDKFCFVFFFGGGEGVLSIRYFCPGSVSLAAFILILTPGPWAFSSTPYL